MCISRVELNIGRGESMQEGHGAEPLHMLGAPCVISGQADVYDMLQPLSQMQGR